MTDRFPDYRVRLTGSGCALTGRPCFFLLRLLFGDHGPALVARDRRTFLDEHRVAHLVRVALVVRLILLRAAHGLLHGRMRETALDIDNDRLLVLVADDGALQDALWHGLVLM